MEKLSGLVLDVYDDQRADILRELFPHDLDLPDLIKTAHAITADEYRSLPDDAFALVLVDGDVELKKFATIDAGNTCLSIEYFLKTAHRLPVEAQKVAAINLMAACGWYDIDPPEELQKVAAGKNWIREHARQGAWERIKTRAEGLVPTEATKGSWNKNVAEARELRRRGDYSADSKRNAVLSGIQAAHTDRIDSAISRPDMMSSIINTKLKKMSSARMKLAFGLTAAMGAMMVPGTVKQVKNNMAASRGTGGQVMTPDEIKVRAGQLGGM